MMCQAKIAEAERSYLLQVERSGLSTIVIVSVHVQDLQREHSHNK